MIFGQPIELTHIPCKRIVPKEKTIHDLKEKQTMNKGREKLLFKGVIIPTTHEERDYISPMFTRRKKDGT